MLGKPVMSVNCALFKRRNRYNNLFPSHVAGFTGHASEGAWTNWMGFWPGNANTTLTFVNGTTRSFETTAAWSFRNGPMNYSSGTSLFEAACLPNPKNRFGSYPGSFPRNSSYQSPTTGADSFPRPLLRHDDDHLRGYYLKQKHLSDIAVLQIPTFRLTEGQTPFSSAVRAFVKGALSDGKSKIIIDLSGNPGGDVNEGFDIFRVFFPDRPIYSATRFRASDLIYLMGKIFSSPSSQKMLSNLKLDPHIIASKAVNPDQTRGFASWDSLFGPEVINGAKMSSIYSVFNVTAASTNENPISGYGEAVLNPYTRVFKPENIIIVGFLACCSVHWLKRFR